MPSSPTHTGADSSSKKLLFVDDDTEILSILLSSSGDDVEDLQLVADRFRNDHYSNELLVKQVILDALAAVHSSSSSTAPAGCFQVQYEFDGKRADAAAATTTTTASTVTVAAFADEAGQQHIAAVMALLHVTKRTATALTLGVLMARKEEFSSSSSSDSDDQDRHQHYSSGVSNSIGTLDLLHAVTAYYYSQRAARLAIIAELLRISNKNAADNGDSNKQAILDDLDSTVTMKWNDGGGTATLQHQRGLFCMLVSAACQPDPVLNRDDYVPAQKLCCGEYSSNNSDDAAWKNFIRDSMERRRVFVTTERVEAMEAIIALLFHRMSMTRADLAVVTTCFHKRHFFVHDEHDNHRLSKLAGLICTESMALWRIFSRNQDDDDDDNTSIENRSINNNAAIVTVDWRSQHPFLQGGDKEDKAVEELQALATLLSDMAATDIDNRWLAMDQPPEAPEALTLLSFGLLLNAAGKTYSDDNNNVWKNLGTTGFDLAKLANSAYDAFGYLQTVMEHMVVPPFTSIVSDNKQLQNLPYDFIEDEKDLTLLDQDGNDEEDTSANELSAPSLTYASIGRELLTASIYAFQDSVLPTAKLPLPDNVGKLSDLVVAIFRNSPTLCERFWSDWDIYTTSLSSPSSAALNQQERPPLPLCHLLQAAHRLATAALRAKGQSSDKDVLHGITPLFQLVASLAYSADIVEEEMVAILPPNLIRRAILMLNSRSNPSDSLTVECRGKVLQCIAVLARIGNTHSSRKLLRAALEEDTTTRDIEGPRTLATIVTASKDRASIATVFTILADLMIDAPFEWIFDVVRALKLVQDEDTVWRNLFTHGDDCIQAMVRVVNGLVIHLNRLVFSSVLDDSTIVEILSVVKIGVLTSSELLSISLSTAPGRKKPITYTSAGLILDCLTNALKQLRPISELHKWRRVQGAAMDFLDYLISILAASHGLGEAIFFYATAPVSLSLATSLDSALQSNMLHQTESDDSSVSMFPSYHGRSTANAANRARSLLWEKLVEVESFVMDMEGLRSRGWLGVEDDEEAPLRASFSAFRLLNWWAKTIEMKIPQDAHTESFDTSRQIPTDGMSEMLGLSPYRLLGYSAYLPLRVRSDALLSSVWKSTGVSTVSLVLKFLQMNEEETDMNGALTVEVLDFISVSLAHEKIAILVDSEGDRSVLRNVYNSSAFSQMMQNHFEKMLALSRIDNFSSSDRMHACVGLRYLRVLEGVVDVNPTAAAKILSGKDKSMGESLVEIVSRILSNLENARDDDLVDVCADSTLVSRLRIATGCLEVVRSIRRYVRTNFSGSEIAEARSSLCEIFEEDSGLMEKLASFVFDNAEKLTSARETTKLAPRCQYSLLTFMALALDVLSIEISWAHQTARISSDLPVVRAIEKSLKNRLALFINVAKELTSVDGFSSVTSAYSSFSSELTADIFRQSHPSHMAWFLNVMAGPSSYLGARDSFVASNGYDYGAANQWFATLSDDVDAAQGLTGDLFSSYTVLSDELRCLSSFKVFAHVLNLLLKKWRSDSPDSSFLLAMSEIDFTLSMTREILSALHKNLIDVERAQLQICPTWLTSEAIFLSRALAGLVLAFLCTEGFTQKFSLEIWVEMMELLAEITKKVSRVAQAQSKDYFSTMKHLFASATVLINKRFGNDLTSQEFEVRSRVNNIYVGLVSTACKVIKDTEQASFEHDDFKSCFVACVALLATATETTGSDYNFSSRICAVLKEFDVIRSLISQACPYGTTEVDNHETELAVLGLFTMMAATGDPNMLMLLASNETALVLSNRRPKEIPSGISHLRGYITSQLDSTSNAWYEGSVWRASMKLIDACLRASYRNLRIEEETNRRFRKLAMNFLQDNRDKVLGCLKQSSSVGYGAKASKDNYLTLNGLREAKVIFSIVSELCKVNVIDAFKRECPSVFNSLKDQSLAFVVGLSTFLGAVSGSREIFRALEEFENDEDTMIVDQGPHFARMSPVYRLLAGGLQNAKHEAIRYSNFVATSSRAITLSEKEAQRSFSSRWRSLADTQPSNGSMSMSSLEHKCRSGVTSRFSFQVEHEAAECLFFAASILWRTHPASSSFVIFTVEEARCLDSMRLVTPGMVIAFRGHDQCIPFGGTYAFNSREDMEKLRFARVLRVDTVNRQWLTQIVGSSVPEECCVQDFQLAGIEDKTKRICMFSHAAAPESSSGLDALCRSATVGHLILALRWCSQFYVENCENDDVPNETVSVVCRLAELLSAFVGMELSISLETSVLDFSAVDDRTKDLANQLLDLFGSVSEFGVTTTNVRGNASGHREGKLRPILSKESWDGVRRQLQSYLDIAVVELRAKLSEGKRPEAGSLFLRRSSSGSSSPFRGLGI